MWSERMEHDGESLTPLSRELRIDWDTLVEEDLEGGDRRIELVGDDIFTDFFHCFMQELHGSHIILGLILVLDESRVRLIQESANSYDGIRIPWSCISKC